MKNPGRLIVRGFLCLAGWRNGLRGLPPASGLEFHPAEPGVGADVEVFVIGTTETAVAGGGEGGVDRVVAGDIVEAPANGDGADASKDTRAWRSRIAGGSGDGTSRPGRRQQRQDRRVLGQPGHRGGRGGIAEAVQEGRLGEAGGVRRETHGHSSAERTGEA